MNTITGKAIAILLLVLLFALPLMWVFHVYFVGGGFSRLGQGLLTFAAICVSLLTIAAVILAVRIEPVRKLLDRIARGETVSRDEKDRARKNINTIPAFIVIVNTVGFFLGPMISAVIRSRATGVPILSMQTLLAILDSGAFGFLGAGLQIHLMTLLFMKPMAALESHRLPDGVKVSGSVTTPVVYGMIPVVSCGMTMFVAGSAASLGLHAGDFAGPAMIILLASVSLGIIYLGVEATVRKKKLGLIIGKLDGISGNKADLSQRVNIIQFDQYGVMADSVNRLMESLESALHEVTVTGRLLTSSSEKLSLAAAESRTASEELVTSVRDVESWSMRQKTVSAETRERMKRFLDQIETIDADVSTQAGFVEESSAAIQEMAGNIESVARITGQSHEISGRLIEITGEGEKTVTRTVSSIEEIANSTREITAMIAAISKIAAQTNLLAMNAAIEAAHAGDSGRGFAVVADEVRRLAEDSSTTTKNITGIMKEMLVKIEGGQEQTRRAKDAFASIADLVNRTTELVSTINDAMAEQKTGAGQILDSMTSLVNATLEIRDLVRDQRSGTETMRESLEELADASDNVLSSVSRQTKLSDTVNGLVVGMETAVRENRSAAEALRKVGESFGSGSEK